MFRKLKGAENPPRQYARGESFFTSSPTQGDKLRVRNAKENLSVEDYNNAHQELKNELFNPDSSAISLPRITQSLLTLRANNPGAEGNLNQRKEAAEAEWQRLGDMGLANKEFRALCERMYEKMLRDAETRHAERGIPFNGTIPGLAINTAEDFTRGMAYALVIFDAEERNDGVGHNIITQPTTLLGSARRTELFNEMVQKQLLGEHHRTITEAAPEFETLEAEIGTRRADEETTTLELFGRLVGKGFSRSGSRIAHNTAVTLSYMTEMVDELYAEEEDEVPDPAPVDVPEADPAPAGGDDEDDEPVTPEAEEEEHSDPFFRRMRNFAARAGTIIGGTAATVAIARAVNETIRQRNGETEDNRELWMRRAGVAATVLGMGVATALTYRRVNRGLENDEERNGLGGRVLGGLGVLGVIYGVNRAYNRYRETFGTEPSEDGRDPNFLQFLQEEFLGFFRRTEEEAARAEAEGATDTDAPERERSRLMGTLDFLVDKGNMVEEAAKTATVILGGAKNFLGDTRWFQAINLAIRPILAQLDYTGEAVENNAKTVREWLEVGEDIRNGSTVGEAIKQALSDIFLGEAFQKERDRIIKERATAAAA